MKHFWMILLLGSTAKANMIPPEFETLYDTIDTNITIFQSSITRQWNGTKSTSVSFGSELEQLGAFTLSSMATTYFDVLVKPVVDRYNGMGMNIVKSILHPPRLHYGFYRDWVGNCTNNPDGCVPLSTANIYYARQVALATTTVAYCHSLGMKVALQTQIQPTSGGQQTGDYFDVGGYYEWLYNSGGFSAYKDMRSSHTVDIARIVAPDYVHYSSEPDTEYSKTGSVVTEIDPATPGVYRTNMLSMIWKIRDDLEAAGIAGLHSTIKTAVGQGSWDTDSTMIVAYTTMTNTDVYDIHMHPAINTDHLPNIITLSTMAIAQGKEVTMNETWIYKESAAEFAGDVAQNIIISRSAWGFWGDIDRRIMTALFDLANWKNFGYVSFAYPSTFFTPINYYAIPGCPPPVESSCTAAQTVALTNISQAYGIPNGFLSAVGKHFVELLRQQYN